MAKKRVISGVQPSGNLTLGNYLGAMRQWPLLQTDDHEVLYFIANVHALNIRPKAEEVRQNSLTVAAWMVAMGIDPKRSVLFLESDLPQISELAIMLNNYVTMGELSRMTQFKEKSSKYGQVVGLFEYPVLMSADIIAFDVDLVPVGDDQRQHVEMARDIATRFNNAHGRTFVVPEAMIQPEGARIMSLQDPAKKMSKSDTEANSYILLGDSPDLIRKKISSAVTDSGSELKLSKDKPAVSNLITIYALCKDVSAQAAAAEVAGKSYAEFKQELAEAIIEQLQPLQEKYQSLMSDEQQVADILRQGQEKLLPKVTQKLADVKQKLGLSIE